MHKSSPNMKPSSISACSTISTKRDNPPYKITRFIECQNRQYSSAKEALHAFEKIFLRWPKGHHSKFLMTFGGFIQAVYSDNWDGGRGWNSTKEDIGKFKSLANTEIAKISTELKKLASGKVNYITIGYDFYLDSSNNGIAELVGVFDVETGKVCHWTGKSYPVAAQANQLVLETETASHFVQLDGENVMVLGCHDLTIWSARSRGSRKEYTPRGKMSRKITDEAENFKPTLILHHPHYTSRINSWKQAWQMITNGTKGTGGSPPKAPLLPSCTCWASGINYNSTENDPLEDILTHTRSDEGVTEIWLP